MTPDQRKKWERRAWDFCEGEHAWEHPCITCQQLAEAFYAVRAEALEEAAKVADTHLKMYESSIMFPAYGLEGQANAASRIAATIRLVLGEGGEGEVSATMGRL